MKITDIQKLLKMKKLMDNNAVPGLDSGACVIDLDCGNNTCYYYTNETSTLEEIDKIFSLKAFKTSIWCKNFTKPTWVIDLEIAPQTEIAKYTEKNYEIEDCTWLNLYFRLISIFKDISKIHPQERVCIIILWNEDAEYYNVKVFTTQEEIEQERKDYYEDWEKEEAE